MARLARRREGGAGLSVNGSAGATAALVEQIRASQNELRSAAQGTSPELQGIVENVIRGSEDALAPQTLAEVEAELEQFQSWVAWVVRYLTMLGELKQQLSEASRVSIA